VTGVSVAAITATPTVGGVTGGTDLTGGGNGVVHEVFTHGMCSYLRSDIALYSGTDGDNGQPLCSCETLEAPGFMSTCQKTLGDVLGTTIGFGFRFTFDPCDDETGVFKYEYRDFSEDTWVALMDMNYGESSSQALSPIPLSYPDPLCNGNLFSGFSCELYWMLDVSVSGDQRATNIQMSISLCKEMDLDKCNSDIPGLLNGILNFGDLLPIVIMNETFDFGPCQGSMMIAIIAGAAGGAVFLLAIAGFFFWRAQKAKKLKKATSSSSSSAGTAQQSATPQQGIPVAAPTAMFDPNTGARLEIKV
jgi:hypothetical protein